ncbi:hypothetical protein CDL15_Pgr023618 [Punica granatum]|uniref:Uncharacterized protein n=1 Tax=Punica granatum TaxID=22663 RepID=A0A218W7Y3_PUNGR|nr:hypothetical protein CDL15_Pgr023618 [Punica granatum]
MIVATGLLNALPSVVDIANWEISGGRHKRLKKGRAKERAKRFKYDDKSYEVPLGWLDCPSFGREIDGCFIPSKASLVEAFNDCILPGKRYSFID